MFVWQILEFPSRLCYWLFFIYVIIYKWMVYINLFCRGCDEMCVCVCLLAWECLGCAWVHDHETLLTILGIIIQSTPPPPLRTSSVTSSTGAELATASSYEVDVADVTSISLRKLQDTMELTYSSWHYKKEWTLPIRSLSSCDSLWLEKGKEPRRKIEH